MGDFITYEEAKTIRLSKNFTLDEFLYSETALRKGIDNSLPKSLLPKIQLLVITILQPLRDKFGPLRISSGYRSIELCLAIGSTATSNHTRGTTADIEPYDKSVNLFTIFKYINDNFEFKELIAEYFPHGWVHVCYDLDALYNTVKLKDPKHNYARMSANKIGDIYA